MRLLKLGKFETLILIDKIIALPQAVLLYLWGISL